MPRGRKTNDWKKDANTTWSIDCWNNVVYIPDNNFRAALLADTAINTNGDFSIQYSEAETFTDTMDVSKNNNLSILSCHDNQLTSLTLFKNTSLIFVYCFNNELTSLDVSKKTTPKNGQQHVKNH